jgi:hypothetical protein
MVLLILFHLEKKFCNHQQLHLLLKEHLLHLLPLLLNNLLDLDRILVMYMFLMM